MDITRDGILRTHETIAPYLRRTPVIEVDATDFGLESSPLTLKLELFQHAGSFKTRGAFANLLTREVPAAGVGAASGGNHGAAVAYAAMQLGTPATIFVPTVASAEKVERIRGCGAHLVITGDRYADALAESERWIAESGALAVHAFDQAGTILGQGTLGLELEEQVPDLDTLLVPVGGGGLIGGVALWYGGAVKIVGVEPETAPTLASALRAGQPVDSPAGGIAADSLAPKRVGQLMFPIAQRYVSHIVIVSDDDIQSAQRTLWQTLRIVAEPGGVAALSALLSCRYRPEPDERVGVIISGGNAAVVDFGGHTGAVGRASAPAVSYR